jgi:hypothetical protein
VPERAETRLLAHVGRKRAQFLNVVGCSRMCGAGGRGRRVVRNLDHKFQRAFCALTATASLCVRGGPRDESARRRCGSSVATSPDKTKTLHIIRSSRSNK